MVYCRYAYLISGCIARACPMFNKSENGRLHFYLCESFMIRVRETFSEFIFYTSRVLTRSRVGIVYQIQRGLFCPGHVAIALLEVHKTNSWGYFSYRCVAVTECRPREESEGMRFYLKKNVMIWVEPTVFTNIEQTDRQVNQKKRIYCLHNHTKAHQQRKIAKKIQITSKTINRNVKTAELQRKEANRVLRNREGTQQTHKNGNK